MAITFIHTETFCACLHAAHRHYVIVEGSRVVDVHCRDCRLASGLTEEEAA